MTWIGPSTLRAVAETVRAASLAIGFWGAIVLPLVAIPALVVYPAAADVIAVVLVANVACLVLGQHHEPTAELSRLAVEPAMEESS